MQQNGGAGRLRSDPLNLTRIMPPQGVFLLRFSPRWMVKIGMAVDKARGFQFHLMVVTSERDLPDETAAWETLREAGLTHLHLRKPHWDGARMEACLESLSPGLRACVRLHDHHDLAARYHVGGLHLNARHPLPPQGYRGPVSRSCHTLAEVERYKTACEYVFLSPVYASISKQGYAAAFTPETLREAAESGLIDARVVAMGGVTPDKLPPLQALGFGGAAVLGALWQAYAHAADLNALRSAWETFRQAAAKMNPNDEAR